MKRLAKNKSTKSKEGTSMAELDDMTKKFFQDI